MSIPDAGIVLRFGNDWELLVAVVLSAQSTDKMVNQVTAELFRKYKSIEDYASADPQEFEQDIHSTGFFRNKAKHIIAAAQKILADYQGVVPTNMAESADFARGGSQDCQRGAGQRRSSGLRHRPRRGHRRRHSRPQTEQTPGAGRRRTTRSRSKGSSWPSSPGATGSRPPTSDRTRAGCL